MAGLTEISRIEARRVAHDVPKRALCRKAGISHSTYQRRLKDREGGHAATLRKLAETLDAIIEAKGFGGVSHGQP